MLAERKGTARRQDRRCQHFWRKRTNGPAELRRALGGARSRARASADTFAMSRYQITPIRVEAPATYMSLPTGASLTVRQAIVTGAYAPNRLQ
jgi:hypothetical protein